jgi:hypothetical protein
MLRWTMSSQNRKSDTQSRPATLLWGNNNLRRPQLADYGRAIHDFTRHARPSAAETDLRRIFNHLDADGNGLIDVFELVEVRFQPCPNRAVIRPE